MNKKLIVVAVAGAIGAPGLAFAQAANVSIYGVIDVRVDSMKFTASTTQVAGTAAVAGLTKSHVQFQAPRWGFRGSESLGGGLTAYFQLESGMNPDGRPDPVTGTGGVNSIGGRDSWIGLRGSWGAVQAGGFGTPYKGIQQVWGANPSMGHGGIIMGNADTTGISPSPNCAVPVLAGNCGNQAEGNATAFSRRQSNFFQYETPNFSGFVGKIATDASEMAEPSTTTPVGTSQSKPKLWSGSLTWSGGPFSAGVAYESHKGFRAGAVGDRMATDKGWTIGGKWRFGQGEIGAGWESLDYGNTGTGAALTNTAFKLKAWVINGSYKITPSGTISAGYSKTPGRTSCGDNLTQLTGGIQNFTGGGCGDVTGAKHFSLGYDHALSKRTALYALYAKLDNSGNANGGSGYYYIAGPTGNAGGGTATGPGAIGANGIDVTTYAVGVKHSF